MRLTRAQMGMVTVVEIVDQADVKDFEDIFAYFDHVNRVFSPFKKDSEVSRFGRREITEAEASPELKEVLALAEQTKRDSGGYFDVWHEGKFDPSGIVKGWAIHQSAEKLRAKGFKNFYVEAGGDIEVAGSNSKGQPWRIGLRHPFDKSKLTHILSLSRGGVATSGTYQQGQHIYNPYRPGIRNDLVSLTVVGPDIYEADRIATAAFAMGQAGLRWLETKTRLQGLAITSNGTLEMTGGLKKFLTR